MSNNPTMIIEKVKGGFTINYGINKEVCNNLNELLAIVKNNYSYTSNEHKQVSKPQLPKKELTKEQIEEREKKNQAILKFKGKMNETTKKPYCKEDYAQIIEELKKQNIIVSRNNIVWVFTRK